MKLSEMSVDHTSYPVRLIIQDACIVLVPSIMVLIGALLFY